MCGIAALRFKLSCAGIPFRVARLVYRIQRLKPETQVHTTTTQTSMHGSRVFLSVKSKSYLQLKDYISMNILVT
jgi:hypothetical protein